MLCCGSQRLPPWGQTIPTLVLAGQLGNSPQWPDSALRAEPMFWVLRPANLLPTSPTVPKNRPGQGILAQLNSGAVEKVQGARRLLRDTVWRGPQESCRTTEKSRSTPRKQAREAGWPPASVFIIFSNLSRLKFEARGSWAHSMFLWDQ